MTKNKFVLFSPITIISLLFISPQSWAEELDTIEVRGVNSYLNAPATNSASTFASPLSEIPAVDVQQRGFNELQADVVVNGGTFEQTGVTIGSAPFTDSQTGHYTFEIPFPTSFFDVSLSNNNTGSFGTSGTIAYELAPVTEGASLMAGIGEARTAVTELSFGDTVAETDLGTIKSEFAFGHSSSSGLLPDASNELYRYGARVSLEGEDRNTDILFGWQEKRFRWPYLYAAREIHQAVASSGLEGEFLQTSSLMINHIQELCNEGSIEATLLLRRNRDDYEFDVFNQGLFNEYRHTTRSLSSGVTANIPLEFADWNTSVGFMSDEIDSTALVFGPYNSRSQATVTTGLERTFDLSEPLALTLSSSLRVDDGNRSDAQYAPIGSAQLSYDLDESTVGVFATYSSSSTLPTYTALSSNPDAGLFRGSSTLGEITSDTAETGVFYQERLFYSGVSFFHRNDDDLVDWVYDPTLSPAAARTAKNINLQVAGLRTEAGLEFQKFGIDAFYEYLDKSSSSFAETTESSFYAFNFPRHRVNTIFRFSVSESLILKAGAELRKEYPNAIRTSSDSTYLITNAAASYALSSALDLGVTVSNIGDEDFEAVPGVPAAPRAFLVTLTGRM